MATLADLFPQETPEDMAKVSLPNWFQPAQDMVQTVAAPVQSSLNGLTTSLNAPVAIPQQESEAPVVGLPQEPAIAVNTAPTTDVKTSTDSTSMPMTPGLAASMAGLNSAISNEQHALKVSPEQASLTQQLSEAEASKGDAYVKEQTQLKASNDEFERRFNAVQADIAQRREAYENAAPKTFWAKADTADKVGMSIAILLGGIAGRGKENLALDTLNKAMEQDWAQQQAKLSRQLKAMEMRGVDAKDILEARSRAQNDFAAYRIASLGQVESKIASIQPKLKLEEQKQAAAKAIAELGVDKAKLIQSIEEKRAGQVKSAVESETKGITNPSKSTSTGSAPAQEQPWGATVAAKKPLTKEQGDSAQLLQINEPAVKTLEAIEANLSPEEKQALERAGTYAYKTAKVHEIPGVGALASSALGFTGNSVEDIYNKALPGGLGNKYYQALNSLSRDQVRNESGAAIGRDEFSDTLRKYAPMDTNNLKDTQQTRRNLLTSHQIKLGDFSRQLFFRQKKNDK